VSGRIAATFPLPRAASGFSAAMAVKVRVKESAEMVGIFTLGLALEPDDDEPLLLHAAARRASEQTPDVTANFLAIRFK